ncbi:MAG: hypothetical protein IRY97_10505, partial [Thermomicrobiaceae bacterium]|nr:hypothetical protein [Thermomicrobiaceae bacterium]
MSSAEQHVPAAGIARVFIEIEEGDIFARWTAGGEIVVRGSVEVEQSGGELRVWRGPGRRDRVEIELPEGLPELKAHARRGDLT